MTPLIEILVPQLNNNNNCIWKIRFFTLLSQEETYTAPARTQRHPIQFTNSFHPELASPSSARDTGLGLGCACLRGLHPRTPELLCWVSTELYGFLGLASAAQLSGSRSLTHSSRLWHKIKDANSIRPPVHWSLLLFIILKSSTSSKIRRIPFTWWRY